VRGSGILTALFLLMVERFFTFLNGIVWGPPMLVLILGVGLYLSIGLKGLTLRRLFYAFGVLCKRGKAGKDEAASGEIPPYQALTTALSATIGTGNIAGVATALFLGGPGALF
jgi:AGCS family alanine or glycine:cation symporter